MSSTASGVPILLIPSCLPGEVSADDCLLPFPPPACQSKDADGLMEISLLRDCVADYHSPVPHHHSPLLSTSEVRSISSCQPYRTGWLLRATTAIRSASPSASTPRSISFWQFTETGPWKVINVPRFFCPTHRKPFSSLQSFPSFRSSQFGIAGQIRVFGVTNDKT